MSSRKIAPEKSAKKAVKRTVSRSETRRTDVLKQNDVEPGYVETFENLEFKGQPVAGEVQHIHRRGTAYKKFTLASGVTHLVTEDEFNEHTK